jgi:hypothetical protein
MEVHLRPDLEENPAYFIGYSLLTVDVQIRL